MSIKVNDTEMNVLGLFTKGYDKEYYIREVEKLLGVSSRTALVTLSRLEKKGILESKFKGKTKTYRIKKTVLSREYFLLTEQYKKIQFLEDNPLIKEVMEKSDEFMEGMAVIFGSYAKGRQKEGSDLDLFVVGRYEGNKIRELGKKYGIEVNIKSYPVNIFEKELHTDILLK
jgi:predicted nucleotidyltransferase